MATPGPSRVKKEEPDDTKPLLDVSPSLSSLTSQEPRADSSRQAEPIEYKLSGAPTWSTSKRLNVMKFSNTATTSKVDLTGWSQPLHLNRRSESALRKMGEDAAASASRSVKTEGGKEEEQQQPRRNPFQKKTQQIKTDESAEVLKMRREERDPWWLEDARPLSSSKAERWTGRLEGTAGAGSAATSHYVLLVLDPESGDFKVVPANRIYNFTKKSNRVTLTAEEADEEVRLPSVILVSHVGVWRTVLEAKEDVLGSACERRRTSNRRQVRISRSRSSVTRSRTTRKSGQEGGRGCQAEVAARW